MALVCDSPIRVLLVGSLPPPYGGIATYVKDLSQAHIPEVEIKVFNTAFPASVAPLDRVGSLYRESISRNGLLTTFKMLLYVLWSYPRLLYWILREHPHIVHAFPSSGWSYWRNWLYLLLAKACGCRTIFHLLNAIDLFYGRVGGFQRALLDTSFRSADAYVVQSSGIRVWLQEYCQKPCYGFMNGIHLERIPPAAPMPDSLEGFVRPIGITIGPLGKHKGTPQILDSLYKLRASGLDCGWVFIGMGDATAYRQQATALNLADRVLFTGSVDDDAKWHYLKHADFYCLPSDAEGQPISILEAMAVGLPIIATAVGSIPEVVVDGQTGYVIPVNDSDALERAIGNLVKSADIRRSLGEAAHRQALERHDVNRLFTDLGGVYVEMMS